MAPVEVLRSEVEGPATPELLKGCQVPCVSRRGRGRVVAESAPMDFFGPEGLG